MPRPLIPCPACAELVFEGTCTCPHCGEPHPCRSRRFSRAAALLGIGMALGSCTDGEKAPGEEEFEGTSQPDYSSAPTDFDQDGYERREGDCDDQDPAIHPNAEETPGDGVDSNCDGDDDT